MSETPRDGEGIGADRLRIIFQVPPDAPLQFSRSTMIVGSRGAGKTTLLRFHQQQHRGVALRLALVEDFAAIALSIHAGPTELEVGPALRPLISGKAISLFATSIARALVQSGLECPLDELLSCLPTGFHRADLRTDVSAAAALKDLVSSLPVEHFAGLAEASPHLPFVRSVSEMCDRIGRPLLLTIDRADMVSPSALEPVLQVLDQSDCVALLALRPGTIANRTASVGAVLAGDHYDVLHLGSSPRSEAWLTFLEKALEAQLPNSALPRGPALDSVFALARDSVRVAIEMVDNPKGGAAGSWQIAASRIREALMTVTTSLVRHVHPDWRGFIREVRAEVIDEHGRVPGPVEVIVESGRKSSLFPERTALDRFLGLAFRSGALSTTEGLTWQPGLTIDRFEVAPVLVWTQEARMWSLRANATASVLRSETQILARKMGMPSPPGIFVSIDGGDPAAAARLADLSEAIPARPGLGRIRVASNTGLMDTPSVRQHIRAARLVVADLTTFGDSTMRDIGAAWGLGRRIIAFTTATDRMLKLPRWLVPQGIYRVNGRSGLELTLNTLRAYLSDSEYGVVRRPPRPIPGLVVWLRSMDWAVALEADGLEAARAAGLHAHTVVWDADPDQLLPDASTVRLIARAGLLITVTEGPSGDPLAQFIRGLVLSVPNSGYGPRVLPRVVVEVSEEGGMHVVAGGSLLTTGLAPSPMSAGVGGVVDTYGKAYRRWAAGLGGSREASQH